MRTATSNSKQSTVLRPRPPPPALPDKAVTTVAAWTCSMAAAVAPAPAVPEQVSLYMEVPGDVGVTVTLPFDACVPLQAPLAVHEVALVEDQLNLALCPTVIEVGLTDNVTVGAAAALTVSTPDALALPPAPVHVSS